MADKEKAEMALKPLRPITSIDQAAAKSKPKISKSQADKEIALGKKASQKRDWPVAVKHLLRAWEYYSDDLALLTILSHALVQLGVREKAIEVLEKTLSRHEPTPDICAIMLQMALEMSMYDTAVKIGRALIELDPNTASHYVNLGSALAGADQLDAGIDMLKNVIPIFPEHSGLWNVLGHTVQKRDGREASKVFFEEALRLNPKSFKAMNNLAFVEMDTKKRLALAERGLKVHPDTPELHISKAFCLMHDGDLVNGFEEYEWRLDPRRKLGQTLIYTHKVPVWDGSSLKGKSLFVTGEQGIGDEILFSIMLERVYEEAEKLYIGCEKRLVTIFERRFPNATVVPGATKSAYGYIYRSYPDIEYAIRDEGLEIDWAVPIASLPRYYWKSIEDIPEFPEGFLHADKGLKKALAERISSVGEGLKVGIAWRSGHMTIERSRAYLSLEKLLPVLQQKGVHFFSLQYTDVREEVEAFEKAHGIKIHRFDDIDMKKNIEANLAIAENLDLVLGAGVSPLTFAASVGTPTWWMTELQPWWRFGCEEGRPKFLPQGRFFTQEGRLGSWDGPVDDVRLALADFVATH
ncbi:MAG: hypothetical protein HWE25_05445 [Alphaproteobacteria bacterium]|nr:hypothetical protein [Alphaproteobacteria bacterium]